MQKLGLDPLPSYTPSHEDPQTRIDLATHYPIQLLSPPDPAFLNSSFANLDWQKQDAGRPTLLISPKDAASRGITEEARVRIFNNRGNFSPMRKSPMRCFQVLRWRKGFGGIKMFLAKLMPMQLQVLPSRISGLVRLFRQPHRGRACF